MSLLDDYRNAVNDLYIKRSKQDEINYRNWANEQSGKQSLIKGLANAGISAALMYMFPPALMSPGNAALLGGTLGLIGGSDALALPYMMDNQKETTQSNPIVKKPNELTIPKQKSYSLFKGLNDNSNGFNFISSE